jgi:hypothetical protein
LNCKDSSENRKVGNPNEYNYVEKRGFLVSGPLEPTHISSKGTSVVLDITVTKNIRIDPNLTTLVGIFSGHFRVLF